MSKSKAALVRSGEPRLDLLTDFFFFFLDLPLRSAVALIIPMFSVSDCVISAGDVDWAVTDKRCIVILLEPTQMERDF